MIWKDLCSYFHKNELFTKCQSGFLPDNSCVSQLLSIVHDSNSSLNCDPTQDVSGVFLDISKVLDKVWHERLLRKLETYGVKGEVLNLLCNYLHERYQRVVLDGQTTSWELIKSVVPQGSVLGPLIFLSYINDLQDNIQSTCKMFAGDTSLFSLVSGIIHITEWTEYGLGSYMQLGLSMENAIQYRPQKTGARGRFFEKS